MDHSAGLREVTGGRTTTQPWLSKYSGSMPLIENCVKRNYPLNTRAGIAPSCANYSRGSGSKAWSRTHDHDNVAPMQTRPLARTTPLRSIESAAGESCLLARLYSRGVRRLSRESFGAAQIPAFFAFAFFAGAVLPPQPATAAQAGNAYFGSWKITSATVAPWWRMVEPDARTVKPDDAEMKLLVGKIVMISAKSIAGPRQLACSGPHYQVKVQPAEGLFQGMFDEMHQHDKSVDARKVAASVGFRGSSWKTLETGCAIEVDYHFLDENTAEFGLNNYIYMLRRQ